MKTNILHEPFGHIIIENSFNENDLKLVWNEIMFLQPRMEPPENTHASHNVYGVPNKNGSGIFLNSFFRSPKHSDIFRITRNLLGPQVQDAASKLDYYFSLFQRIVGDSILIQCYKNGDYYLPHKDYCLFTVVTLLHNNPKKFYGGEFYFPEQNYQVQLQNNSTIIFPSCIPHEVKEVKLESNDPKDFRYTISMFLDDHLKPTTEAE